MFSFLEKLFITFLRDHVEKNMAVVCIYVCVLRVVGGWGGVVVCDWGWLGVIGGWLGLIVGGWGGD